MNNKKLSRLLEPNLKLYFLCMIVFAAATATGEPASGTGGDRLHRGLYAYFTKRNQRRGRTSCSISTMSPAVWTPPASPPSSTPRCPSCVPAGHRRGDLEQ